MSRAKYQLLSLEYDGNLLEVHSDLDGVEELYVNNKLISTERLGTEGLGNEENLDSTRTEKTIELQDQRIVTLRMQTFFSKASIKYELLDADVVVASGQSNWQRPDQTTTANGSIPWLSLGGLVLKLFKSASIVKVALFGASYASFSILTDWRLGALLIAILVFHEYGHLRAMKSFGMKTKGMYLIPFVGGVAVGEKATTYWQETYISMQGPVFGLYMTLLAWLAYAMTDWALLGALASFSALINVFNLLPIYPLDGGHVIKASAMSFSKNKGSVFLVVFAAFGVSCAFWTGLYLLAFFSIIGALDLIGAARTERDSDVVPMNPYGVAVSLAWYLGTICTFIFVMYWLYLNNVPGANIPMLILQDR